MIDWKKINSGDAPCFESLLFFIECPNALIDDKFLIMQGYIEKYDSSNTYPRTICIYKDSEVAIDPDIFGTVTHWAELPNVPKD